MNEKVKLFFEVKKIYPELTVQDVESFCAVKPAPTAEYSYQIEKDICIISKTVDGKSQIVSRIKGDDATATRKIAEIQKSDSFTEGQDGLLQFVYDKLKGTEISK